MKKEPQIFTRIDDQAVPVDGATLEALAQDEMLESLVRSCVREVLSESIEPDIRVSNRDNFISAVLMMGGYRVGYVTAREVLRWKYCADDVEKLKAEGYDYNDPEWPTLGPQLWAIDNAQVDQGFRGQGLGKDLYVALIEEVGRHAGDRGAFVGADECAAGSTSKDAQRVWRSLARDYPSSGNVVYVGPK